jgi:hypothetical protein
MIHVGGNDPAQRPVDLTGLIDPHVHTAPEHIPRLLDDLSLARQARAAGMAGLLIKSHTTLTADRAVIAALAVPGIQLWGGLVLNRSVGGFNPAAVETAIAYGAAEIWLPTIDADNHRRFHALLGAGLSLRDEHGYVPAAIHEIMQLIADHDLILGTGHLSPAEIHTAIPIARQHGVKKILITHPEAPFVAMPLPEQLELAAVGCRFERTWVFTTPAQDCIVTPERLMHEIRYVGWESTVLATDMGQIGNPSPVDGLRMYIQTCLQAGFTMGEIRCMATNIRDWLP